MWLVDGGGCGGQVQEVQGYLIPIDPFGHSDHLADSEINLSSQIARERVQNRVAHRGRLPAAVVAAVALNVCAQVLVSSTCLAISDSFWLSNQGERSD